MNNRMTLNRTLNRLLPHITDGSGGKPDWFWALNLKGQVPVLVDGVHDGPAVVVTGRSWITNLANALTCDRAP